jgi:hypothetical protein
MLGVFFGVAKMKMAMGESHIPPTMLNHNGYFIQLQTTFRLGFNQI